MTFLDGKVTLHAGDCFDVLKTLPAASVDSCVTDPPYALVSITKRFGKDGSAPCIEGKTGAYARASRGFMGKQWDTGERAFTAELWAEVLRVLKPGGHILAFGGTRTYHRLACAIEDAGFEIRDQIQWLYGSGFPKSHDVGKGIDRELGAKGSQGAPRLLPNGKEHHFNIGFGEGEGYDSQKAGRFEYVPGSEQAEEWKGWGTAIKPACEPIVLARKSLIGTVAANVLAHGTGALNIDGCRVATDELKDKVYNNTGDNLSWGGTYGKGVVQGNSIGRWPANVIHDGSDEVVGAFPETESGSWNGQLTGRGSEHSGNWGKKDRPFFHTGDSGSAARFFYTAKADADDRIGSKHPTVKPVDLIQYLVRLITPKGGTVLDCFAGTGTTGEAAYREGMKAILIEREAEYVKDIERRMALVLAGPEERSRESLKARGLANDDAGPLFGSTPHPQAAE